MHDYDIRHQVVSDVGDLSCHTCGYNIHNVELHCSYKHQIVSDLKEYFHSRCCPKKNYHTSIDGKQLDYDDDQWSKYHLEHKIRKHHSTSYTTLEGIMTGGK